QMASTPRSPTLAVGRRCCYRGAPMRRLVPLILVAPMIGLGATAQPAAGSPLWDPTAGRAVFTGPTSPHGTSPLINPAALQLAAEGIHAYAGLPLTLDQYGI